MNIAQSLLKKFAKITNDNTSKREEAKNVYGNIVQSNGVSYVQIDGSTELTPLSASTVAKNGDRVLVTIGNHQATVIGNFTVAAGGSSGDGTFENGHFKTIIVDNLIDAQYATALLKDIQTENINVRDTLTSERADIDYLFGIVELLADTGEIGELDVEDLDAKDLTSVTSSLGTASANSITAPTGNITNLISTRIDSDSVYVKTEDETGYLEADNLYTTNLEALEGYIHKFKSDSIDAKTLDLIFGHLETADIDYAKIGEAWISHGFIQNGAIVDGMISSLNGSKIIAGTIDAGSIGTGTLDAGKITVKNLNADNITTGTINGQRIGNGSIDLSKLSEEVPTKEYIDELEERLQNSIDGGIEVFTLNHVPTLQNEPAINWTDDTTKNKHVGDIAYVFNEENEENGWSFRFANFGTETEPDYQWVRITDSELSKVVKDLSDLDAEVTTFKDDTYQRIRDIDGGIETITTRITEVDARIDNVQVGGRNLFNNSTNFIDFIYVPSPSYRLAVLIDNASVPSKKAASIQITSGSRNTTEIKFDLRDALLRGGAKVGDQFVLSFYARSYSGSLKESIRFEYLQLAEKNNVTWLTENTIPHGQWNDVFQRYIMRFKVSTITMNAINNGSCVFSFFPPAGVTTFPVDTILEISSIKLEKGNVPSDWTEAPEDVSDAIAANRKYTETTIKSVEDTVNGEITRINKSIEDITSDTEDNIINKRIKDATAVYEQTIDSNKSRLETLEQTAVSLEENIEATNEKVENYNTEIVNKYSELNQSIDAISLDVTSNYETKSESTRKVNEAISTAALDATSKASTAKSEAISTASADATSKANAAKENAISAAASDATTKANAAQEASKSYTDDSVNSIDIGGRNLLEKTNTESYYRFNLGDRYPVPTKEFITWLNVKAVKFTSIQPLSSYTKNWAVFEYRDPNLRTKLIPNQQYILSYDCNIANKASLNVTDSNSANPIMNTGNTKVTTRIDENGETYYHHEYLATVKDSFTLSGQCLYNFVNIGSFITSANNVLKLANLKLEKGTKATDWTPAPEDTENKITVINETLNSHEARIALTETNINLKVSSITFNNFTEAIANDITESVETSKKYAEDIVNATDSVGRNLVINSSNFTNFTSYPTDCIGSIFVIDDAKRPSKKYTQIYLSKGQAVSVTMDLRSALIGAKVGDQFTLSFYAHYYNESGIIFNDIFDTGFLSRPSDVTWFTTKQLTDDWRKYAFTFKLAGDVTSVNSMYGIFRFTPITKFYPGDFLYVSSIKLEKGNQATDWRPSSEELDDRIKKAKEDAITTAGNNTTNALKSYSTTNEMNSAIDIAKNAIVSSVSEVYQTKEDGQLIEERIETAESKLTKSGLTTIIENYYATPSSVQEAKTVADQTAEKFSWLVKSGTNSTNFELTDRTAKLVSDTIDLSGLVKVSDLSGSGTTIINGNNIKTGSIMSNNYEFNGSTGFAKQGLGIDLTNGSIYSKNFKIDGNGDAEFNGKITASTGAIGGFTISSNSIKSEYVTLLSSSNGIGDIRVGKIVNNGTMTGIGSHGITLEHITMSSNTSQQNLIAYFGLSNEGSPQMSMQGFLNKNKTIFISPDSDGITISDTSTKLSTIITSSSIRCNTIGVGNGGDLSFSPKDTSNDTGDIVFYYSNGKEKCRIFAPDAYTTSDDTLYFRCYKSDGTQLKSNGFAWKDHTHAYIPTSEKFSLSSHTDIGYGSNNDYVLTKSALAFWNGRYNSSSSNLAYCNKGAFGSIVTKSDTDYLKSSGGTLTGDLRVNTNIYVASKSALGTNCRPTVSSGQGSLGTSSFKWSEVFASKSAINTSDRNLKSDIIPLSDKQEALFERLKPVSYKFKGAEHDRTHYGFISQDVEESMYEIGMTALDFAGFCKDKVGETFDDDGQPLTFKMDQNGDPEYEYSLRYGEFIALNTHMIQKLMTQISDLQKEVKELKSQLQNS